MIHCFQLVEVSEAFLPPDLLGNLQVKLDSPTKAFCETTVKLWWSQWNIPMMFETKLAIHVQSWSIVSSSDLLIQFGDLYTLGESNARKCWKKNIVERHKNNVSKWWNQSPSYSLAPTCRAKMVLQNCSHHPNGPGKKKKDVEHGWCHGVGGVQKSWSCGCPS